MYALTAIKGCGRRYANICCKKAEINLDKRAGELVSFNNTCFVVLSVGARMMMTNFFDNDDIQHLLRGCF